MSGEPVPLALPPGLNKDLSQYTAKQVWWDGNLVRWNEKGVMSPIGGWVKLAISALNPTQPIRKLFSWRDNNFQSWTVVGSADKVYVIKILDIPIVYDITPTDLLWQPSTSGGFGANAFGLGRFGIDTSSGVGGATKFDDAMWSFDNWGEDLLGVHSADGRLLRWSPSNPTAQMALVPNAPIGNRIVIVTNERHCMLLGGYGAPRKVKWSARENIELWAASATNNAGGWDIDTRGVIFATCHVPNGILVLTDIDIYIIDYAGPPEYYSRRLVSDETGIVGPNAIAPTPNGAILLGPTSFWEYSGSLARLSCSLSNEIFSAGQLNVSRPNNIFMGVNAINSEIWTFYPGQEQIDPNKALIYNFESRPWWTKADLSRTAWLDPIWQQRPYAALGTDLYEHENGWTANGADRDVWAESGTLEIGAGERNMRVDRIYPDTITDNAPATPLPYSLTFSLRQAPQAPLRTLAPIILDPVKGYTTTRFRARQVSMRLEETAQQKWGLGTLRLRTKPGGKR